MGASRKLQGEIDRVLKKVQEGVDVFDSIWNKVYDTDNANQKEKFEADLKKEIKKLQRYRDQIKTWIQSSEIKDKKVSASYEQALMDARKLIEKEMERFKICEKETKTKAFSKEGLGQQPKTDPKEKAKSETRDWLNNTVSELESQIDSFEAEMEGLSVRKGKARPPRLTHLESSINRHKAHIMKLELILRLLDNDELSPEQVNDVKDFLDDYVERNQEDFDEFDDVDMLYNTLPLDKVESLEDLVTIGPPGLAKGVGASGAVLSIKSALSTSSAQLPGDSVQEQVDETAPQDGISEFGARTPPPKSSAISSASPTSAGIHATPAATSVSSVLSGPSSVKGVLDNTGSSVPSSPISSAAKEEEISSFPGRKPSPVLVEAGLRNLGRGGMTNQSSISIPVSSGSTASTNGSLGVAPSVSDTSRRAMLGGDERLGSSGMVQPLVSSLSSRMILSQGAKISDAVGAGDSGNNGEAGGMTGRVFPPSGVAGIQWRPGNPFQNQHEGFRGRTEIAPDQREKFLQRFQQVQQQGQGTLLGMPSLSGGNHKQFTAQQNPLLQQFNSQSSAVSPHGGMIGSPAAGLITATSAQQQPSSIHSQSGQHTLISTGSKDTEAGHVKADELQQHQSLSDDSATSSALDKNTANEDDLKVSYASDTQTGVSVSVTEPAQVTRDIDLSPGQPLQSNQSASLGVIGRRSVSDLGAIGESLSGSTLSLGASHDQQHTLQMLEAAFYKLPQPKDSERAKSYTARHPAVTPQSYPQVQAPVVSNPAFWERLGSDNIGTDTLFFAFYYQQNTYQQYLAAKELKKQSWRYHKKYNTWFQRHEEPKVATDDYEQGTYVYFDFHMGNDEMQHGWCQRIKSEFKFEYNFLEDELVV
ncbi:general negative regulator of transcription subunit 3 [Cynara cardunculus var. scolymus]|uniref:general negative regulator of transcription subunit 3 n=1 Tax=Cynara cardunculus var. scolymus TaxID=59895 RepID=UPI000D62DB85|nr:general negative regulator of transcription subunit 3 [Cynara cardunculus var. scolymus]